MQLCMRALGMCQSHMDTLGFEPRAFRMRSGCDTTTPCAPCGHATPTTVKITGDNHFQEFNQAPKTFAVTHHSKACKDTRRQSQRSDRGWDTKRLPHYLPAALCQAPHAFAKPQCSQSLGGTLRKAQKAIVGKTHDFHTIDQQPCA